MLDVVRFARGVSSNHVVGVDEPDVRSMDRGVVGRCRRDGGLAFIFGIGRVVGDTTESERETLCTAASEGSGNVCADVAVDTRTPANRSGEFSRGISAARF